MISINGYKWNINIIFTKSSSDFAKDRRTHLVNENPCAVLCCIEGLNLMVLPRKIGASQFYFPGYQI